MDENGDVGADLNIISWVVVPEEDPVQEELGSFERQRLIVNQDTISWLKLLNKVRKVFGSFLLFPEP